MDFFPILLHSITEFLPISSSIHTHLVSHFWPIMHEVDNIALHLGSLIAIALYFYRDILSMVTGACSALMQKQWNPSAKTAFLLIIATIPVVIAGYVVKKTGLREESNYLISGILSIIFGVFLWISDSKFKSNKSLNDLTWRHALGIGAMQCFSLLPGASRLGTSLTGARLTGLNRLESVHFAFLMSMPALLGATILTVFERIKHQEAAFLGQNALFTVSLTAILSFASLHLFSRWMANHGFFLIMLYRVSLGFLLIGLAFFK